MNRQPPLAYLEPPTSGVHTHREHIYIQLLFLSMPRNTESLVRVVGRAQFLLFTRMAEERLSRSAQPLCSYSWQLKQARAGTAGPPTLPASVGTLAQSPPILMSLFSCPVLPSAQGISWGTSRLCPWNHGKASTWFLPGWKNVLAKLFPNVETPLVPG